MLSYKVSQHPHSRPRGYAIDIYCAILMALIGTVGGVGGLLCWDEMSCLPVFVDYPSRAASRAFVLWFSRLLHFHFLGSIRADPHIVLSSFLILLR